MRAKPPPLEAFAFRTTHELRYSDADMNGHINNGLFGSLMETNRALLFRMAADEAATEEATPGTDDNTMTVIARFEIDYLAELHFPGQVIAASGVEKIGGASFVVLQALFCEGRCVALGRSTIVILDRASRRATPIGDSLRAALENQAMRKAQPPTP